MTYDWGDERGWKLTAQMKRGPLKNVFTTPEMAEWYGKVLDEIDRLDLTEKDELMVVGVAPWIYLYTDAGCRQLFHLAGTRGQHPALRLL